ncbi:MAG: tryptophan--tRNA ligase [Lentisphaerae bacterium]|jgi:tryptophanyl-tRNA synthetase|nr:tryptophan--tRNA ligase [Lentisphaerota bacterium]
MRVLSGIQPSGKLHLGNYFGMMKQCVELQEKADAYIFIANYHALTTVSEPEKLRQDTTDVALDFLSCGLDPEKAVFFRQSDVPAVQELTWLLSTVCPVGLLERAHSYKDKIAHGKEATHALFAYPVLMAADILIFQSDIVPVGKDQKQHLEIARDLAIKFNNKFGETFKVPEPQILEEVALVPGIDGQKMSKSYNNTIELSASPKATRKAIMSIVTDSTPLEDPKDPDTCTVYHLYKLMASPEQVQEMADKLRAGGYGYGDAKKALLNAFNDKFSDFREKRAKLAAEPERLEEILQSGAKRAQAEARKTLKMARKAIGVE